jgi:hypothetical protein
VWGTGTPKDKDDVNLFEVGYRNLPRDIVDYESRKREKNEPGSDPRTLERQRSDDLFFPLFFFLSSAAGLTAVKPD